MTENFDSSQAPHASIPENKHVVDVIDGKPIPFREFRFRQLELTAAGRHTVGYGAGSQPCPVCSATERITVALEGSRGNDPDNEAYDICLSCWSAMPLINIYKPDISS